MSHSPITLRLSTQVMVRELEDKTKCIIHVQMVRSNNVHPALSEEKSRIGDIASVCLPFSSRSISGNIRYLGGQQA